jgi:hypothetical protein
LLLITAEANVFRNGNIVISSFLDYINDYTVHDKYSRFSQLGSGWLNMGQPLAWRNININFTAEFNLDKDTIINDYLMHSKLEELGKFLHLPRVFYHYIIRNNSSSRKLDEYNNFNKDNSSIHKQIELRRQNKEFNSASDLYNDIIDECKAFYYCDINHEQKCNDVSFVTTNELTISKKNKIRELYCDHNINYNVFNGDIDYYICYLDKNSDISRFIDKYEKIDNYKQTLIFCYDNLDIFNGVKEHLGYTPYSWFCYENIYIIFRN